MNLRQSLLELSLKLKKREIQLDSFSFEFDLLIKKGLLSELSEPERKAASTVDFYIGLGDPAAKTNNNLIEKIKRRWNVFNGKPGYTEEEILREIEKLLKTLSEKYEK